MGGSIWIRQVDPREVRFTQDSIACNFKEPHNDTAIVDAVNNIVSNRWSAAMFPKIRVVEHEGVLWSLDNRRLWVFRQARVPIIAVKVAARHTGHCQDRFQNVLANPALKQKFMSASYEPKVRGKWDQRKKTKHDYASGAALGQAPEARPRFLGPTPAIAAPPPAIAKPPSTGIRPAPLRLPPKGTDTPQAPTFPSNGTEPDPSTSPKVQNHGPHAGHYRSNSGSAADLSHPLLPPGAPARSPGRANGLQPAGAPAPADRKWNLPAAQRYPTKIPETPEPWRRNRRSIFYRIERTILAACCCMPTEY